MPAGGGNASVLSRGGQETLSWSGFILSAQTAISMELLWFRSNFRCEKKGRKTKNKEGSGAWPRQNRLMGSFFMKELHVWLRSRFVLDYLLQSDIK